MEISKIYGWYEEGWVQSNDMTQKKIRGIDESLIRRKCWKGYKIHHKKQKNYLVKHIQIVSKTGMFKTIDQIRQILKPKDFIKNIFSDPDFKDMKNDREFLKYLKSIYEGFSSDVTKKQHSKWIQEKGKKVKKNQSKNMM